MEEMVQACDYMKLEHQRYLDQRMNDVLYFLGFSNKSPLTNREGSGGRRELSNVIIIVIANTHHIFDALTNQPSINHKFEIVGVRINTSTDSSCYIELIDVSISSPTT